ncbi:MAG: hypothetical protein IKI75_00120 [Lachnospiraceae bacterium]|nr:hypothetical protein [Lachnospiraceae bacterium]
MTETGYISLYSNTVAIMLSFGVFVLVWKFKIRDKVEKRILLGLLANIVVMALFYILCSLRDSGMIPCSRIGAMFMETGLEMMINIFAMIWFLYTDYRIFHSIFHIKRNIIIFTVPFILVAIMNLVNIPTAFMFDYDMNEHVTVEKTFYVIADIIRLGYFFTSMFVLTVRKRRDEKMKFFSIRAFIIPLTFYVLLYYFTDYNTVSLGLAIGTTLIYAGMVNEKCYQDSETGFYNRLYLDYLKKRIHDNKFDLRSIAEFVVPENEMEKLSPMISKQLPESCFAIRYGKDRIIVLSQVKDRGPLSMLTEDVQLAVETAGGSVETGFKLKKKNETAESFLDDYLKAN